MKPEPKTPRGINPSADIEITPYMIEAGVAVLEDALCEYNVPCKDDIAIQLFSAMIDAYKARPSHASRLLSAPEYP